MIGRLSQPALAYITCAAAYRREPVCFSGRV
jgi:hypothetical protein